MALSEIWNLGTNPFALPLPYTGLLLPGAVALVSDTEANVIANLGGAAAIRGWVDVRQANPSTQPATDHQNAVAALNTAIAGSATPINLNGGRLTNVGTPTAATDGATMGYVDANSIRIVDWKESVRAVRLTNLAGTYSASAKTLTASANGAFSADGVGSWAVGQRVALVAQTDAKQSGIYAVTVAGTDTTAAVLTRANDFDASNKITNGASFWTGSEGSTKAVRIYTLTSADPITLDTSNLAFTDTAFTLNAPVISGTITGTYALGGTPSLGVALDANGQDVTSLDEVGFADGAAGATAVGRLRRNGTNLEFHDGTASRVLVLLDATQTLTAKTLSSPTLSGTVSGTPTWASVQVFPDLALVGGGLEIDFGDAAAGASGSGRLRRNGTNLEFHDGVASRVIYKVAGTDVAVADGGTGASDAGTARTNLGVAIGSDVQAFDATLLSIAALGTAADRIAYATGVDTWAETPLTAAGRALIDDDSAAAQRTTLGVAIGTDVQAFDATLAALAAYNTNGLLAQTAADTFAGRAITGTANQVTVTNGDGVAGNPTLSTPQDIHSGASPSFFGLTLAGNQAFTKEVNHTVSVAASTTVATVGANLTLLSANGNGAAGGNLTMDTGSGTAGGLIEIGTTNGGSIAIGRTGQTVTVDSTLSAAGGITMPDGSLFSLRGRGTGTGDVVQRIGNSVTEGMELVVYEDTISPAAVETNAINVPAGSIILSVQANVQTALTGGGTTVTWSVGTAGDPDKYGTAGYPSPADSLAQNSNSNWGGAWAFLTSAEQIVLTGAATGGAADGDTALTVGSVRIRVIYYTLNTLDAAA